MSYVSYNVKIPNRLKIRLSDYNHKTKVRLFVNETGYDALRWVKQYGIGTAGGRKPTGGAPVWQGRAGFSRKSFGEGFIRNGHYRGYLSESHYLKRISPTHVQIASSAEFVDGVLGGYSTNWSGITFGANNYHKRAVDKLFSTNSFEVNWKRMNSRIGS